MVDSLGEALLVAVEGGCAVLLLLLHAGLHDLLLLARPVSVFPLDLPGGGVLDLDRVVRGVDGNTKYCGLLKK